MPFSFRHTAALAAGLLLVTTAACDSGGGGGSTGPVTVASVTLSSNAETLQPGETAQLTATARAADGTALSGRAIAWTSSNESVATVSATGLVTAVDAGTTMIRAASEGREGTASITVVPPVFAVQVTPATADLVVGGTVQLAATPRSAAGDALPGRSIAWSSDNTAVATVNNTGMVTAHGAGTATVSATVEGVVGTVIVRVTTAPPPPDTQPPALVSLSLAPDTVSIGSAQGSVMATLRITDDLSGVQNLTVNLTSPTRSRTVAAIAITYAPETGTRNDGTWVVEIVIPTGVDLGTWTLTDLVITDVAANTRVLSTAQLQAMSGVETTVVVRN